MGKITTLPTVNMDRPSTAFFWGRHAPLPSLTLVKLQAFHFLSQKGSSIETELRLRHIILETVLAENSYSTIILSCSRLTVSGIYRKSRHATNWVCERKMRGPLLSAPAAARHPPAFRSFSMTVRLEQKEVSQVKSTYEPSGSSVRSLSWFQ